MRNELPFDTTIHFHGIEYENYRFHRAAAVMLTVDIGNKALRGRTAYLACRRD